MHGMTSARAECNLETATIPVKVWNRLSTATASQVKTHTPLPSLLPGSPLLARVYRLLGKGRRRRFFVRVVPPPVEIDLHVVWYERSALVNSLDLLQPLLVLIASDVLD